MHGQTGNSADIMASDDLGDFGNKSSEVIGNSNMEERNKGRKVTDRELGIAQKDNGILASFDFEKHTTGFGSRMLQKMGFQGSLGASQQGISKPIELNFKKDRRGISSSDRKDVKQYKDLLKGSKQDSLEENARGFRINTKWRRPAKSRGETRREVSKVKTKFVSFEEIAMADIEKREEKSVDLEASELYLPTKSDGLDEFVFNYSLLSNVVEEKIRLIKSREASLAEEKVDIVSKAAELERVIDMEGRELSSLSDFIGFINEFISRDILLNSISANEEKSKITLKTLLPIYEGAMERFRKEATSSYFEETAAPLILSLASQTTFDEYRLPFSFNSASETSSGYTRKLRELMLLLGRWKAIISEDIFRSVISVDLADAFITSIVRAEFSSELVCHASRALLALHPLLGDEVVEYVFINGVYTKLYTHFSSPLGLEKRKNTEESFNQSFSSLSTVEPLFTLTKNEALLQNNLLPIVRKQLLVMARNWDGISLGFAEAAKEVKPYFSKTAWGRFMLGQVYRKLKSSMKPFSVNPRKQSLNVILSLFRWKDEIPPTDFIHLLEMEFFPKWHAALQRWLEQKNSDILEIKTWYLGWRTVFDEIIWMKSINLQFTEGLKAISNFISQLEDS